MGGSSDVSPIFYFVHTLAITDEKSDLCTPKRNNLKGLGQLFFIRAKRKENEGCFVRN